MYTSQKSIEAKAGSVEGWKDLLKSVGFRFEPAANNIPAAVFFPQSDPGERLTQCSASLHPLLGPGSMWGVNAHERDHNPASSVTITSLFMLVFIIFNGRLLSTGTQKALLNMKLNFNLI